VNLVREAIRKRYALLSFWYTMFYEHERFETPIMRPMLMDYPLDRNVYTLDDQYMLSDKLLVRPVMEKGAKNVTVRFPSTDGAQAGHFWYDTDDYHKITAVGVQTIDVNINKTPVYQRGGTIITKKEIVRKSTVTMTNDPVSLYVAVDKDNRAKGTLFIDDETSYDYRESKYLYLAFDFNSDTLTSSHIDQGADFETECKLDKVVFAGVEKLPSYVTVRTSDGESRLEIVEFTQNYFVIDNPNVSLRREFTIILNGAKQNVSCTSLLIATFLVLVKNLL